MINKIETEKRFDEIIIELHILSDQKEKMLEMGDIASINLRRSS